MLRRTLGSYSLLCLVGGYQQPSRRRFRLMGTAMWHAYLGSTPRVAMAPHGICSGDRRTRWLAGRAVQIFVAIPHCCERRQHRAGTARALRLATPRGVAREARRQLLDHAHPALEVAPDDLTREPSKGARVPIRSRAGSSPLSASERRVPPHGACLFHSTGVHVPPFTRSSSRSTQTQRT